MECMKTGAAKVQWCTFMKAPEGLIHRQARLKFILDFSNSQLLLLNYPSLVFREVDEYANFNERVIEPILAAR
jgi:hypothetical protein